MFAHEVLAGLDKYIKINRQRGDDARSRGLTRLISSIKESVHFYLGDLDDISYGVLDKRQRIGMEPKEFLPYMRPPYKQVFFMWTVNSPEGEKDDDASKRASLVLDISPSDKFRALSFQDFYLSSVSGSWEVLPFVMNLAIGYAWGDLYSELRLLSDDSFGRRFAGGNWFPMPSEHLLEKIGKEGSFTAETGAAWVETVFGSSIIQEQAGDWKTCIDAMIFLNCRNGGSIVIAPPARMNRSRKKHGKQPLLSYRVLTIKAQEKMHHGEPHAPGDHVRVHLQRGHYKHYTAAAPLMGQHVGLWWWQPHVRGRNREGIVLKDYAVG